MPSFIHLDANRFKEAFEEAQRILEENEKNDNKTSSDESSDGDNDEDEEVENVKEETTSSKEKEITEKLNELKVDDSNHQ